MYLVCSADEVSTLPSPALVQARDTLNQSRRTHGTAYSYTSSTCGTKHELNALAIMVYKTGQVNEAVPHHLLVPVLPLQDAGVLSQS